MNTGFKIFDYFSYFKMKDIWFAFILPALFGLFFLKNTDLFVLGINVQYVFLYISFSFLIFLMGVYSLNNKGFKNKLKEEDKIKKDNKYKFFIYNIGYGLFYDLFLIILINLFFIQYTPLIYFLFVFSVFHLGYLVFTSLNIMLLTLYKIEKQNSF